MRPFEAPAHFPLRFRTVVPVDMHIELVSSGEGDAIRFESALDGVHRPDALFSLTVLPAGQGEAEARAYVADVARLLGGTPARGDELWPGVLEQFTLRGSHEGRIALGHEQARWYILLLQHPPGHGDRMSARADLILRGWEWTR